jgi:hypothetical protein
MANMLEGCNTEEHRSFVSFLWTRRFKANDIHKEIFPVYGRKCDFHLFVPQIKYTLVANVSLMKRLKRR